MSKAMTAFIGKQNDDQTVTFPDHEVRRMYARIAKLERGLRLVRNQIKDDHEMNLPTDRAAQSLILADIDIAMSD